MEEGRKLLRGGVAALTWMAEQAPSVYLDFTPGILHLQHNGCIGFTLQKGILVLAMN
jgi:hypothetical protein